MTTTATRPADSRRRPFRTNRPVNWRRTIAWVLLAVAMSRR